MARQPVVQVQCDRCRQYEFVPAVDGPPNGESKRPDFEASFSGQSLVYGDLCSRCRETVANLWEELREWDRKRKYTVLRHGNGAEGSEEAAPLQTAPDYRPPKPHSPAADKR